MPGLTIIVASADPARFHAALSLAAAHAALDRATHLFLHGEAVALLRQPISWSEDDRYSTAGLPTLGELLGEAITLGVHVTACQSGLALSSMRADELPEGVELGGLVELLATHESHQLIMG